MQAGPEGFAGGGCWCRVVSWPEDEVTVLAKREGLTDAELEGHDEPRRAHYTDYSRVSYLRQGLALPLRGTELGYEDCTQVTFDSNDLGDAFGVFIRPLPHLRVAWWFTGRGQTGPDNVVVQSGQPIDNGLGDAEQLRDVTIADVAQRVAAMSPPFAVNEAMLRYRLCDVTGLLVNSNSLKSLARAVGFLVGMCRAKPVPLFTYDPTTGQLEQTTEPRIKAVLNAGRRYERKRKDYAEFYETLFAAEYARRRH